MDILTNGRYVSVYCEQKFSYIIDNILSYYDIEKYNNTVVVLFYDYESFDAIADKFEHIIIYNVEHLKYYSPTVCKRYVDFFKKYLDKILEFWDFDILNYQNIIYEFPQVMQKYKFVPFRYVDRLKVNQNSHKKFDAIQIGRTRWLSPYRDKILFNFEFLNCNFSLLTIEKSKYSLEELYDEINSAKFVLNIPRLSYTLQEQVRIGELLCMNCNVITESNSISYMQDYVHEIDYFSETLDNDISNITLYDNIYEKFKNDTNDENFNKYVDSCFDKWHNTTDSYYFSVVISSTNIDSLNNTVFSLKNNNIFNKIQIIIVDLSTDDAIEKHYNNLKNNIYYIKSDISNNKHAFNIGMKCSVGKYISFCNSGDLFFERYYDYAYDDLLNSQTNIRISNFMNNNQIMIPAFETLKIGPILQCCIIKRNIINIEFFENLLCSENIFTGILCKMFNYKIISFSTDRFDNVGPTYFNNVNEVLPENFNWIEYVQEKINEYQYV